MPQSELDLSFNFDSAIRSIKFHREWIICFRTSSVPSINYSWELARSTTGSLRPRQSCLFDLSLKLVLFVRVCFQVPNLPDTTYFQVVDVSYSTLKDVAAMRKLDMHAYHSKTQNITEDRQIS